MDEFNAIYGPIWHSAKVQIEASVVGKKKEEKEWYGMNERHHHEPFPGDNPLHTFSFPLLQRIYQYQ